MIYKINTYELCEHVVEVNDQTETVIGMIRPFGHCFEAFLKNIGQVSENGFEIFEDRQAAINCLIKTYSDTMK